MTPLLVINQSPLTQRYKSVSSSADRELIREKLAVVLVIRLLQEGSSPPLEQLEDTCSPGSYQPLSGQTSCIQASQGYYVPQTGSSFQTPATPGNFVPNLEQPPKYNAVRKLSAFVRTDNLYRRVCRELCCDIRILQSNCLLAWDIPAF